MLTKTGGGSPYQNLTFLKNISLVSLPKSNLTKKREELTKRSGYMNYMYNL